jgi:ABC-2 type transport system ATP-binding protein
VQVELQQVSKTFGRGADAKLAVNDVSWTARGGEVFGLLGPNGAGKTTMIRMMLDIIRPDNGEVLIDDDQAGSRELSFKSRVGYLPEERGLYKRRKVIDVLCYLGALKGLPAAQAKAKARALLERFDLADWAHKKVEDLSKGMSQKIQIAACIIHEPEMVVLDEPFSGLDPVNVRLVREVIMELRAQGRLVFLSTHMMAEVEALCDRIFMIHEGNQVLYGNLRDIRKSHTEHEILLDADSEPEGLACVAHVALAPRGKYVRLHDGRTIHDLMAQMAAAQRPVRRFEEASTPIEDIFVSLVSTEDNE